MMFVKVDHRSEVSLHEQISGGIRRAIADGDLRPGQRLPPARDLAAAFDVNPNTVLRALRSLREDGLLSFRRGRGVTVIGTTAQGEIRQRVRDLLADATRLGYSRAELIRLIEETL